MDASDRRRSDRRCVTADRLPRPGLEEAGAKASAQRRVSEAARPHVAEEGNEFVQLAQPRRARTRQKRQRLDAAHGTSQAVRGQRRRNGREETILPAIAAYRHRWTRATAAGTIGAALLLAGCTAAGPLKPFGNAAREDAIRRQAQADPFPTAQQAGLTPHQP